VWLIEPALCDAGTYSRVLSRVVRLRARLGRRRCALHGSAPTIGVVEDARDQARVVTIPSVVWAVSQSPASELRRVSRSHLSALSLTLERKTPL